MSRKSPEPTGEFMTASEMSAALSLSVESVYRLAGKENGLQVVRLGRALQAIRRRRSRSNHALIRPTSS